MGSLSFLTPAAALVGLAAIVPVAIYLSRERHAQRVREELRLGEPSPGRFVFAALLAVPVLSGIAAAQPVLDRSHSRPERTDAELFFAIDTTRSMLAATGPEEPTRLDRARTVALGLRGRFPRVRAGIASVTDRTLPHLFPTIDALAFRATLERSVGIQRPPPSSSATVATDLGGLAAVARQRFFTPGTGRRLLVVLTDGETRPVGPELAAALRRERIHTAFVHLRRPGESVFVTSAEEHAYRSDPSSGRTLRRIALAAGGAYFSEEGLGDLAAYAEQQLGEGPTRPRRQRDLLALMPWFTAAAFLPLGFVLLRRNA